MNNNQQDALGSPDAKEMFGFATAIIYFVIMTLSAFWALLVRKPGTLGTRAYWMDYGFGNLLFLALKQHFYFTPNRHLFIGSMVVMTFMYFYHLAATMKREDHVHTKCIGTPRFWGGEPTEFIVGLLIGFGLIVAFPTIAPYGYFLIASATALAVRGGMLEERDRLRAVQMEDALWEQDYMMKNYERFKKGQK